MLDYDTRQRLKQAVSDAQRANMDELRRLDRMDQMMETSHHAQTRQPIFANVQLRSRAKFAKASDEDVVKAWARYEAGLSLRKVAAEIWQSLDFASVESCAQTLNNRFRAAGHVLRPRSGR